MTGFESFGPAAQDIPPGLCSEDLGSEEEALA